MDCGYAVHIYNFDDDEMLKENKEMDKKTNKKGLLGIVALLVLVAALGLIYNMFKEKPVEGSKQITIEVIDSNGASTTYEVQTNSEFLQQAMDEAEGLEYGYEEGEYGPMVNSINGELASYNENGAYWGFFVNDNYCNYGIAEQPIEDGDVFQIVYTLAE